MLVCVLALQNGRLGLVLVALPLVCCSDDPPARPAIVFDVDHSGCSAASCARGGELFVLRGARVASGCLLARRSLSSVAGQQSQSIEQIAAGDVLSFVLTLHCGERCAVCQAVAEGITARDGQQLALHAGPAKGCVVRGELPGGARPRSCSAVGDGGLVDAAGQPDTGGRPDGRVARDSRPDQRIVADGAAGASCGQIYSCAKTCKDTGCLSKCIATGCSSANTAFSALVNCGVSHCPGPCRGGFDVDCLACLKRFCDPQLSGCLKHKC